MSKSTVSQTTRRPSAPFLLAAAGLSLSLGGCVVSPNGQIGLAPQFNQGQNVLVPTGSCEQTFVKDGYGNVVGTTPPVCQSYNGYGGFNGYQQPIFAQPPIYESQPAPSFGFWSHNRKGGGFGFHLNAFKTLPNNVTVTYKI